MEGINYCQLIQNILANHSANDFTNETEIQLLFDTERHHYQVLNIGWEDQKRVFEIIIHVDIKDNKIWIQRHGTEIGIADELVAAGVPKDKIVLGFQAPYKRPFTDFAVS
ncbi:XisI protein [Gloeothece citriformis PCC 7424]|uniref:XisI protein n=1 Tax=Gloeothece citriformis (strain PCC 7424) TaxID=65393 RepID=B7KKS5_GLOC7|nr:XisI protein [Gloeothece citriformis]ACK71044.1 XisI protein [Gloeothece citriformis PCC 7424]